MFPGKDLHSDRTIYAPTTVRIPMQRPSFITSSPRMLVCEAPRSSLAVSPRLPALANLSHTTRVVSCGPSQRQNSMPASVKRTTRGQGQEQGLEGRIPLREQAVCSRKIVPRPHSRRKKGGKTGFDIERERDARARYNSDRSTIVAKWAGLLLAQTSHYEVRSYTP